MSPRETAQAQIVEFLRANPRTFNAPYGVLESLEAFGKGKCRVITFGCARTMDATIRILQPNKIIMESSRHTGGEFSSAAELVGFLRNQFSIKERQ